MDLENIPTVSKEELLSLLHSDHVMILNVLASHAFEKLHIKNSISAPYDRLEKGEFDHFGKDRKLIVYCASYDCGASRKAASILRDRGIDVAAYEGGIKEWAECGYPTEGTTANEGHQES